MKAPLPLLVAVPDRDDDNGKTLRHAARQRYLTTLADGLPCSGRELANMYGMSERWGCYQIRAARRNHTTHPPTNPPDSPTNTTNHPHAIASQRSDSS
nr:hypothetical protein [Kibdelosporangium sp. MJ126-NF4]CEL13510.1 hypothetical protein [Kibdelosporangium sp. MJ126-NF4]CTQ99195.1 hypothetical protein [Kibdelosporangium sp. MJ126-NF4]